MLRLKLASRAAKAPGTSMVNAHFRTRLRGLLCWLTLAAGVLLALPALAGANPITTENALTGSSGWERGQADAPNIEGYTNKTSVAPGETISFSVSTTPVQHYRVIIYRLGWYNGAGARQMTCLPSCTTTTTTGVARSTPNPNPTTGKIDAGWTAQNTLTVPSNWTSGEYVAEYVLTDGSQAGLARYSPFVVRSSAPQASASDMLVVVPFNTYLAYNKWGNTSAYDNLTDRSIFTKDHATKVSFNRPFHQRQWRFWDVPLLRFLEREGEDVSYVSDTDVDANPGILLNHRAVIVSGHSEYWSKNMRDGFDAARDAGTNLLFAGANDAYWQVRYEDSSCPADDTVCPASPGAGNRRTMVIYKQEAANQTDPISDPALKTIKWRDLGRPECELQGGVMYGSWFPNDGYRDYTTTSAGASDPWAQGSGLTNGSTVSGLTGFEYDSFFPDCDPPGTPTILFQYQGPETAAAIDAAAVRYTDPSSGTRVFSSGSEQWAWGLDSYRWDPNLFTGIPPTNPAIQQFTRNMLTDMANPAAPVGVNATRAGSSFNIDTTPRADTRITSYKVYRHAGAADFKPGDAGVTLVCQNASGDCTDTPSQGAYRYASVAVDQWHDSAAALSQAVDNFTPPTAVNDSATVSEDVVATAVSVTANDTNPSGQPITIGSVTQPANGTVAITGGGTGLTYKPNANYCNNPPGSSLDTFTYTINGGSTGTVSMTVTCVDDAPVAVRDPLSAVEDDPATALNVLTNDTDIDGGLKEITSFAQPAHGTVTGVGAAGHWTDLKYQPSANYCNFVNGQGSVGPSDDFTYTLNGGSTNTVAMTVDCRNDLAAANDDSATLTEDAAATAIPVLSNDSDVEGDPFSIISTTNPAHGSVQITGGGTGLTYQPNANYCGPDSFTYTVTGGDTATVSMTVTCVNDLPVAVNDSATVNEDAAQAPIPVLSNDTDVENDARTISSATDPAHGTVTLSGGTAGARTTLSYQPDANYCNNPPGTSLDAFQYTINGGSTATVSVTINCVDDGPVAHNDAASVNEEAPATAVDVLTNDTDIDGGPKTINSVTQPNNGTVAITGGGTGLTYQPNPDYCNNNGGTADKFSYTLNGGSTGQVSMTVFCADDAPLAVHDSKSVIEDAAATAVDVLANDTDVDAGPKTVASVTQPTNGTVVRNSDGSGLTYRPNANYCNFVSGHPELSGPSDNFSYTLNGGSTASVSMTVDCVDDAPVANNDSATFTEDDSTTAIPVLTNDTDVDDGQKGIASVTQPANGTVDTSGGGAVLTYKPNANYCNTPPGTNKDTFSYTLNGGSTAQVSVTVNCVDDLPVAVNDSATVAEDANATSVPVLGNDTDIDAGPKTINSVNTTGTHGTVAITGGGSGLTYKPDANYCNTPSDPADTFTYNLNGGSTATVSMTVTCVDDTPHAVNDSDTVTGNSGANAIGALANDTDIDGGPKTISSFTQPSHGIVAGAGGSTNAWTSLTYDPTNGYCGPDSFGYTVNGGSTATVSITVDCSGAPTAVDDTATFTEDGSAGAIDVLSNDTDPDGGTNTIQSTTDPANGTVAITGGGSGLTYKPDANYCNTQSGGVPDGFNYTLNGGSTGQVSVTVTCVNDDPTAADDTATVSEDASATQVSVLANDNDVEGDAITIGAVTQPSNGTVAITGGGTGLTYKPNANYCNTPSDPKDTFTYTVNGGSPNKTATVSMAVTCVDDSPAAVDDSFTVSGNSGANSFAVLGNDTDIDGGPKTITGVTQPDNGAVNLTGSNSLTYTPNPEYCSDPGSTDDFDYTLAGGSTATVSVTVDCSQAPTAVDDSSTVNEDASATAINVRSNDTDPDGGEKTIQSITQPTHGLVAVTGAGTGLTYKPNANYCNSQSGGSPDTFTYTLNGDSTATVSMTVTCVDDAPNAANDTATITEGDPATAVGVLSNDTDIDGGPKTINSVTQGAHGSVDITGGSTGLTYTLDESYCDDVDGPPNNPSDTFTYTLNGGSTGTVSVTITCLDDDPVAEDDTKSVSGNSGATQLGVLSNDTDVDSGPKAIDSTLAQDPQHGTVVIAGDGLDLTYQPESGYCGDDSFDYKLVPGGDTATVSMDVDCSTPPTAANDHPAAVARNAGATAINVLANDTDSDGGPITINDASDPAHGTVVIDVDGLGLTYQPDTGYCNTPSGPTDNFTYTLNGGSSATVFMTVTCPAVPPPTTTTTTTTPQQQVQADPPVAAKKCKKGFKRVKGKCKKKKRKRK